MLKAFVSKSAPRCLCQKGLKKTVNSNDEIGYLVNPNVRVGYSTKCPVRQPPIVEEDEFVVFGKPQDPPSAPR